MTPAEIRRLPPLRLGELLTETLRIVATAPLTAWAVILAWSAVLAGGMVGFQAVSRAATVSTGQVVTLAADTLTYAVASGVLTRVYLRRRGGAWRIDRGFGAYVAIVAVLSLVRSLPRMAPFLVLGNGGIPTSDAVNLATLGLFGTALSLLLQYPIARLILWPTGKLAGDARATWGFSWSAMGGWAAFVYLAAYLVLYIPSWVINAGAAFGVMITGGGVFRSASAVLATMLLGVLSSALHAATWRLRMPRRVEDIGEVFA